ncbi:MAG: ZIP family metal transporter [Bacteroidia bacterium]
MQWWWMILLFILPLTGGIIGLNVDKARIKELKLFLAFGGAFLISITILNLIPEVYEHMGPRAGYFVLGGFFLQIVTDYFSKGIEHGHIHLHEFEKKFPMSVFIALGLHALLEGVGVGGEVFSKEAQRNLSFAIGMHEIPAAFALAVVLKSAVKRAKSVNMLWVVIYALMVPIGLFIGSYLKDYEEIIHAVMAIVIGVFLHISTTILFENSESHKFSYLKLIAIAIGLGLALVVGSVHIH